ncbi:MAG: hypothetical protein IAE83_10170 [Anaerolinea sp.]|nr:hypothetical protein [Anaerolinea sp.]
MLAQPLDDPARFRATDSVGMFARIYALPDDLESAWRRGLELPLNETFLRIGKVLICGSEEGAFVGELVTQVIASTCNIPTMVSRSSDLPAFADGQSTLVILIDPTGDDLHTLAARDLADARGTKMIAITPDGALSKAADKAGSTVWTLKQPSPPRAAIGEQIGLLLAFINRLGWGRDLEPEVREAVAVMRAERDLIGLDVPPTHNPAKRLAWQMIGRIPLIYGAGAMATAARRWKSQINQNAKAVALADALPDLLFSTLSGLGVIPDGVRLAAFCLATPSESEQTKTAQSVARSIFMMEGIVPDMVSAKGKGLLTQVMYAVQFGDYVSCYLAVASDIDPTLNPAREEVESQLRSLRFTR